MAISVARQRRPQAGRSEDTSGSSSYSKEDKKGSENGGGKGFGWMLPFMALGILRYMSATSNIIHDCDEVFNYWEPLHYLLYKSGFQTWEYRFTDLYAYSCLFMKKIYSYTRFPLFIALHLFKISWISFTHTTNTAPVFPETAQNNISMALSLLSLHL